MKVIDAFWEKRNLGVSCKEVVIEKSDTLDLIKNKYDSFAGCEYLVIKVPSEKSEISLFFQEKGCKYVESLFHQSTKLDELCFPDSIKPILNECSWQKMDEKDFKFLLQEMEQNIFYTDRIFLDPYFTNEQAAIRYINWIKDLYIEGVIPYKVVYEGNDVGFFIEKRISDTTSDGILVGIYSAYQGTGLGYCVEAISCIAAREMGYKKIVGRVSSNNIEALKATESLGARIKSISYVFVKHKGK